MKKTLKVLLLVAFMAVVLLALTGCGDKLVATRESEEMGMEVKEKIEVSFKKDKVNKIKWTYEFEDKDTAEAMSGVLKMSMSMLDEDVDMDIKQSGKKVIMKLDAKAYAAMAGEDEMDIDKDELEEKLEEEGYKVK